MLSHFQPTRNVYRKKNNRLRKQDDGTKADILDFFFYSIFFKHFVADACQAAPNATFLYSCVFLLLLLFFLMQTLFFLAVLSNCLPHPHYMVRSLCTDSERFQPAGARLASAVL